MSQSPILSIALVLILCSLASALSPPEWNNPFTVKFNETTKLPIQGTHNTTGVMYYVPNKFTRIDRANGKHDRYCATIHPLTNTKCIHWVSEGVRYLHFPQLNDECCRCCTADRGCGVLKTDWLSSANDEGVRTLDDGTVVHRWNVKGLQDNIYDGLEQQQHIPKQILQMPNDLMYFDTDSYQPSVDPKETELPQSCKDAHKCPLYSLCTIA